MELLQRRENMIRQWFAMWLSKQNTGLENIFSPDAIYIESWGPEYHGTDAINHWFEEWNPGHGPVLGYSAVLSSGGSDGGPVAVSM